MSSCCKNAILDRVSGTWIWRCPSCGRWRYATKGEIGLHKEILEREAQLEQGSNFALNPTDENGGGPEHYPFDEEDLGPREEGEFLREHVR